MGGLVRRSISPRPRVLSLPLYSEFPARRCRLFVLPVERTCQLAPALFPSAIEPTPACKYDSQSKTTYRANQIALRSENVTERESRSSSGRLEGSCLCRPSNGKGYSMIRM